MTSKHFATTLSIAALAFTAFVPSVQAQECVTQYGGEVVCPPVEISINKMVAQPVANTKGATVSATPVFVENLGTNQPFAPEQEVLYRLVVKNTSAQTLSRVTVKDVLPQYLTFVSGPGSYDTNTRTLTVVLENMTAGESRTIDFLAKFVPATQFPAGQSAFCVTNYAEVRAENRFDDDTAQACVTVAPTLPVAGFNDLALLLPFAGVGLSGLALLKKRN